MLIKTIDGENKQFYFTTKLSDNIEILDNGFMRCNNIIMGGIGTQKYSTKELGIETSDGQVHIIDVNRYAEDIFHLDTLKSFEGMAVIIGHKRNPDGSIIMITSDNESEFGKGYILNMRRNGDDMVGDIIVKDKATVDSLHKRILKKDLPKVSLGYVAKYELDGDDALKQVSIIGNHLAIMEENKNGRYGKASFVDEENQELEGRGNKPMEKEALFTKFLRVLGIKKATLDDDTEITVEEEEVVVVPVVEEEQPQPTADETIVVEEVVVEVPKVETPKDEVQPTADDSKNIRKVVVEEHRESDYSEETIKSVTVEETETHYKTDEEIEEEQKKKKENTVMKITLDEALARIEKIAPLKGTEAYQKQIATIDSEMVESGLGSILSKDEDGKLAIFGDVKPTSVKTGDEEKPKFKSSNFISGISAIYSQFTPKSLNKSAGKDAVDRQAKIRELSSYDTEDLISGRGV